jgi:hypothetical protein
MASLTDILTTVQQGVTALNNLGSQVKGSLNNISAQISNITSSYVISFNSRNGAVVPAQGDYPTSLIPGSTANNNATAGNLGEYVAATVSSGSAVSLTTATPTNVTSINLSAGDWTVYGQAIYGLFANTNITVEVGSLSATSSTMDSTPGRQYVVRSAAFVPAGDLTAPPLSSRFVSSVATTVNLVAQLNFTASAASAYGTVWARRPR